MSKTARLVQFAQEAADHIPDFFTVTGPGEGNRKTNEFMRRLRHCVETELGSGYDERKICGDSINLAVDFFIEEEQTVVEVALSLRNSNTEFERDILKTLIAKERGYCIQRLLFLSKPGARKKHEQPSSRSIIEWVKRAYDVEVEVCELVDSGNA